MNVKLDHWTAHTHPHTVDPESPTETLTNQGNGDPWKDRAPGEVCRLAATLMGCVPQSVHSLGSKDQKPMWIPVSKGRIQGWWDDWKLGLGRLGNKLNHREIEPPSPPPRHPQSDCHVYPSLYLPAELHRLRDMLERGCCKSAAEQRRWLLHGEGESDFSVGPSKFASLRRTTTKSLEK